MSDSTPKMDNPDAAAPETYTKKDQEKAFNNGKTAGLTIATCAILQHCMDLDQHIRDRKEAGDKVLQLCRDYELHSSTLDGSMLEILQEVQNMLDQDISFLHEQKTRCRKDLDEMLVKVDDMKKILEQQTKDGY